MTDAEFSAADLEAVRDAVEAVVARDEDRVSALLADPGHASGFWLWADDYGSHGKLDLVMPPGRTMTWEINAVPFADGRGFPVDVPMWAVFGRTDLTLRLRLERDSARSPRVLLEDLHVL